MANQQQDMKRRSGLWLSRLALGFVALAAAMGWGASFVGLHAYGLGQMVGFNFWTAWLIPATFDGAAFGATLITYRASIHGRSAIRGRLLMWIFTGISAWINWIHQTTPEARIVACGLPVAAVAVFDVVLAEMRADYEARHGKRRLRVRPGLLLLRWLVDRRGTSEAFRQQVTNIPVSEIAGLGQTATWYAERASLPSGEQHGSGGQPEEPRQALPSGTATASPGGAAERPQLPAGTSTSTGAAPAPDRAGATARTSTTDPALEKTDGDGDHARANSGKVSMAWDDVDPLAQTVTLPVVAEGPRCPWPSARPEQDEDERAEGGSTGEAVATEDVVGGMPEGGAVDDERANTENVPERGNASRADVRDDETRPHPENGPVSSDQRTRDVVLSEATSEQLDRADLTDERVPETVPPELYAGAGLGQRG